jgi:hypothetical protein
MIGSHDQSSYSGGGASSALAAARARGEATRSASPGGRPSAFCEAVK